MLMLSVFLVLLLHLVAATPGPQDQPAREDNKGRQGVVEQLMRMQEDKAKKQGEEIYL